MTIEWQRNPDNWIGTTEINYPRFEAWQSDNPVNNCWCLNVTRSAGQEPIRVRELPSSRAVETFVEGFMKNSGDESPKLRFQTSVLAQCQRFLLAILTFVAGVLKE